MFKLIKKVPYWYIIAIPLLSMLLGAASNQAVLMANGDKFPVFWNNEKIHVSCQTPEPKAVPDFLSSLLPSILAPQPAPKANPDPDLCQNGGKFLDNEHVIMDKGSHLKALADIFDIGSGAYSIGDGLLAFGEWVWEWAGIAWLALIIRKFIEA